MQLYQDFGKRYLDLVIGCLAVILIAPLLMLVGLAVRLKLGTPIIFTQVRPGKNALPFHLYKFRTMTLARDCEGQLLSDADRLPSFGKWLRSTSLDELPELWNILRGDMSLIGPRPLLMEYLEHYTPEQARRHEVKPGITGWAQVHGRNQLSWEEKFQLDVWYVNNQSLWLDLKILVLTVFVVLTRRGISAEGHATVPRFDTPTSTKTSLYDQAA